MMTKGDTVGCNTQGTEKFCDPESTPPWRELWSNMDVPPPREVLAVIHGWLGDELYAAFMWTIIGMGVILILLILQFQTKRVRWWYLSRNYQEQPVQVARVEPEPRASYVVRCSPDDETLDWPHPIV